MRISVDLDVHHQRAGLLDLADLTQFYKAETFGVPATDVLKVETPKPGVTITWDRFGVPHIKGVTYDDVAWGAGYAGTKDRMFLQDVLRHAGAARASEFLGASPANVAGMSHWRVVGLLMVS